MEICNLFILLAERKISAKKLSDDTGISTGNISDWKSGRNQPSINALITIANYLNVSIDYLVGRTEEKQFVSETQQKLICPFCNSPLRKHDWGYGCSGFKTKGCKFHINATIAGKKITENQVIHLCQNGRTNIIKGFKAKSGSEFDAYLFVDKDKKEVSFQFPDRKK